MYAYELVADFVKRWTLILYKRSHDIQHVS